MVFPHGENSRDIRSQNITVMLYLRARWSYISATHAFWAWVSRVWGNKPRPFVASHVIFSHLTRRFSAKNVWNDLKFLGHMPKIPRKPLRSSKQLK